MTKKQRIVRRMERFDCHGRLHVTIHNGIATVKITHQQSHKSYVNIDIPDQMAYFHQDVTTSWDQLRCVDEVKAPNSMKLNEV
jgi:hypothetical protein